MQNPLTRNNGVIECFSTRGSQFTL